MHSGRRPLAVLAFATALAVAGVPSAAATGSLRWNYQAWQTEEGLPDLSITGVAQTTDGYLWVATKGGVASFNGREFSTLPAANFPAMPSRAVRAMFHDRRDRLWLGMERGPVLCLKADGLQVFTTEDGLPAQRVLMITEDREGAIWVVYPNQIRRLVDGSVKRIALPADWSGAGDLVAAGDGQGDVWCAQSNRLRVWRDGAWASPVSFESWITAVCCTGTSELWVAAGNHLFRFQEGTPPVDMGRLPSQSAATCLLVDRSGALWIGTVSDGLFRWQADAVERVPTSQQEITCLFEDLEGNILAGTAGGGLNIIRPRVAALSGAESGLPFESVLSVSEDSEGGIWAVAQDGSLGCGREGGGDLLSDGTGWPGGKATCVATDPTGGVWVGTRDRGLQQYRHGVWREWLPRDGYFGAGVRSLLMASNGDLWVASLNVNRLHRMRAGRVQTVTNTTHLGAIRALAERADGSIWIGTSEGEVQRVADMTLIAEPAIAEFSTFSVRSLLATSDGSLWIGYAGEGLGRLKDGHYEQLTSAEGLADDFITQLLDDGGGYLWIAGNRGLSRASFEDLDSVIGGRLQRLGVRRYGSADGLPGLQPNRDYWPSAWRGRDGRLLFSMRNGLLVVQPDRIVENPLPPTVRLEWVGVDDQLVALYNAGSPFQTQAGSNVMNLRRTGAKLQVAPGHRKLEIEFAALSFASPENVQFRYRLSSLDSEWVEAGSRHSATYSRLPAGNYEFSVIACNNTGVWNSEGVVLEFAVLPFFWETWWFKLGGGIGTALAAGGCAYAVSRVRYRRRLRRLEAKQALEQERARIAKDIHDDLGASLTRISLLSQPWQSKPDNGEDAVENLAQIHQTARDLTHAMGEVVWAVNPEHDTFDSLANYISNYAQNFLRAARIRCRLEMPVQLPHLQLSSGIRHNLLFAFKEALSNVARHAQASEVRIVLMTDNSGLELLVADNGRGFSVNGTRGSGPDPHGTHVMPGNGLRNMRSRLQELGGYCDLKSEPGAGTRITFRVTLKKEHGRR